VLDCLCSTQRYLC